MSKLKKEVLAAILSLCTLVAIVWGAQSYLYTTYATAEDVKRIEQRLDIKILEDRLSNVQERIWKLEDRYHEQQKPQEVYEQLRVLSVEKDKLKDDLKSMSTR